MASRIALLVNPASGNGRALRAMDSVADRFRQAGVHVDLLCGRDADESARLAREAVSGRPDALVAFGGDGLVHLAVQAVAGSDVPLGVLPGGSANDLARVLGIPLGDPIRAAEVVLAGHSRRIDAGRCGETWFANVVSCGLDAAVSERAIALPRLPGSVRYLAALAAELPRFRPVRFTLELDGEEWQTTALFVAIGNASTYGTGMRICPHARLDDGLLDVVVVGVSRAEVAVLFPLVYGGWHLRYPRVAMRRARTVSVAGAVAGSVAESAGGSATRPVGTAGPDSGLTAYTAGERLAKLPLTCEAVPGALRVIVPGGNNPSANGV